MRCYSARSRGSEVTADNTVHIDHSTSLSIGIERAAGRKRCRPGLRDADGVIISLFAQLLAAAAARSTGRPLQPTRLFYLLIAIAVGRRRRQRTSAVDATNLPLVLRTNYAERLPYTRMQRYLCELSAALSVSLGGQTDQRTDGRTDGRSTKVVYCVYLT